ncbi:stage II sporulation protein M, partial [Bacillus sp. S34]|nr:stage II sporulation protein M [Bacillus sp. S34]
SEGRLGDFFLYIAPHGQLELYSVFLAAAAGLMIFWSWVAPGARTRAQALAEDGRALAAGPAVPPVAARPTPLRRHLRAGRPSLHRTAPRCWRPCHLVPADPGRHDEADRGRPHE